MAQSYTRQSTFADGDTITASLFNNEYNQLLNAFAYSSSSASTTGHRHDGSTGQGGNIPQIGDLDFNNKIVVDSTNNRWGVYVEVSGSAVEQVRIQDGAIVPVTDNDIDLGTSALEFKDLFLDGTAHVDTLDVDVNATVAGTLGVTGVTTLSSDLSVGGNLTVTGNATIAGNLTFGDAASDTVAFSADVASNLLPSADNTYDLGASGSEWKDLYIDGTANIDSLVADTADINGGTIDGATIATSDITVGSGKTLNVSAGTLTLADNQISGDKVEGGTIAATTITTLTSTTGNITSVNATTVDATNLEVTTLKAKDGTAAGSIADSTGVVTVTSSVLTTTDINGGTIDGVTIGGSSAGDITYANLSDGTITITAFVDEDDMSSDSATLVPTQQSVKAYVDAQVTAQDFDFQGDTGGALSIDLDSEAMTFTGGTGIDTSGSGNAVTFAIDSTVTTLTGSQTLTNKVLTSPDINTPDIDGGTIDGTVIGGSSAAAITGTVITGSSLDISGDADIDGTLEADAITVNGTALGEVIADTVGAMVSSNTETNITVTYEDSDNTLDFVIGTLNQDTTGNAATATALETARTIGGTSFDGTANIAIALANTATTLATARTIGGVSFDGSADITPTTFTTATFSGDVNVDSGVLFVDVSENKVGINQTSPDVSLDLGSNTDAVHVPVGTTAQRPGSPAAGYFRYNTSLAQFEGYTDAWGAIGGGGTNTFTTDSFTGNGSTTAYALSQATASEDNLLVFIEGVFQQQDAYSIATAGGVTTLTFSSAPANGNSILIYSVAAGVSGSNLNIDTMTGDGSDTTLTLSINPVNENNTQVFIDGVYQSKANYSISGTTLTFSTAPPTGSAVEVMTMTQTEVNVPVDGTITSAKLSGDLTLPGDLSFADDSKAIFGAGSDLQIYHDGSHSYISDQGTGDLRILAADFRIRNAANDETMIQANSDADVSLWYNNSKKLATTNTGIDVTGSVTATKLVSANGVLELDDNGTHNGIINSPASLIINIDSDANSTGEDFIIAKDRTSTSGGTELFRVQEDGNVGIGTASPAIGGGRTYALALTIDGGVSGSLEDTGGLEIGGSTSVNDRLVGSISYFNRDNSGAGATTRQQVAIIEARSVTSDSNAGDDSGGNLTFGTKSEGGSIAEHMRLDDSGNLLVGKTASNSNTAGHELLDYGRAVHTVNASTVQILNRLSNDGTMLLFEKDGSNVGQISTEGGDMAIGNDDAGIQFVNGTEHFRPFNMATNAATDALMDIGSSSKRFKDLYLSGNAYVGNAVTSSTDGSSDLKLEGNQHIFRRGSAGSYVEQARLDASGNFLVGKSSTSGGIAGSVLASSGLTRLTASGIAVAEINRLSSDGSIVDFKKDGTTVGSIGSIAGGYLSISGTTGGRLQINGTDEYAWDTTQFYPANDNANDLGFITKRWDDIYATNGTIQTSDRNEKQDIEELSDAEQRVAVAAKGLLRKFRWKSSVAEKGDEARTHFGIIAQDLQAAFAAEGLDAGDYAMFIHTTWTDEETGEERSRMGVRYSELLAFIIAAI